MKSRMGIAGPPTVGIRDNYTTLAKQVVQYDSMPTAAYTSYCLEVPPYGVQHWEG